MKLWYVPIAFLLKCYERNFTIYLGYEGEVEDVFA